LILPLIRLALRRWALILPLIGLALIGWLALIRRRRISRLGQRG
jgi:hypothetical protein